MQYSMQGKFRCFSCFKLNNFLNFVFPFSRQANGIVEPLKEFDSPCTCESLRLACNDSIVRKSIVKPKLIKNPVDDTEQLEKLWAIRT